jgi:hypothetical protein
MEHWALHMLHDLVETALQRIGDLADLHARLTVEVDATQHLAQFADEFDKGGRENC